MLALWLGLPIPMTRAKKIRAVLFFGIATVLALCARVAVYRGLGGYPPLPTGEPAHFRLTLRTIQTLLTHPAGISLLGVNATVPFSFDLLAYNKDHNNCFGLEKPSRRPSNARVDSDIDPQPAHPDSAVGDVTKT
jgi:hypothetical protein